MNGVLFILLQIKKYTVEFGYAVGVDGVLLGGFRLTADELDCSLEFYTFELMK